MSVRELVLLGTASQVPTRTRNHNGYVLRWDGDAILFDPGEGTQRQLTLAEVAPPSISHICITHFHGDHCLGLPGVIMRLSLDGAEHPVHVHYPASGQEYIDRLRQAAIYGSRVELVLHPHEDGDTFEIGDHTLSCRALEHSTDTLGWRFEEPDGRTLLPDRLAELEIEGPAVGRLQAEGVLVVNGRTVTLDEVSVARDGQSFAFVMDTGWCDAAIELARGVDLLVCEATFLEEHADLAREYGHLTAAGAARLAVEAGARRLVLTHFSQRYPDVEVFGDEARTVFDDVVVGHDLDRVPLPERTRPIR